MKFAKHLVRLAIVITIAPLLSFAQSDRGAITGTVLDPGGAAVPSAAIIARNIATGALSQTVTTPTGNFTIASLSVGDYEISIEAAGFKKFTQTGIRVLVAQVARLNITLQVGALSESITVTADAALLKTENAEQSVNVSGDRINSLPLNFGGGGGSTGTIRSWTSFSVLSPGVSGSNTDVRVNGMPPRNFKIIVEGQDITSSNDTGWTSTVSQASVEMIEEFSLQTSNFSAEFGQVGGGLFNFTTRSGTNQFHGSGYEYFQNEALDAHRPMTNNGQGNLVRPRSRKNDFGGSIGGPVWIPKLYNGHDKTFFFFNYEMFRTSVISAGNLATVPTDAYRNGDFSAALTGRILGTDVLGRPIYENAIYDPLTTRVVDGKVVRDPFPGNIIPQDRLDPVALNIQALIPRATDSSLINNWVQNAPNRKIQSIPAIKVDHNFDSRKRMSVYWSKQRTDQFTAPDGLPFPITARRDQKIYSYTGRVNYDQSLTPTLLVHLGSGYIRFHNPDSSAPEVLNYDAANGIGFTGSATDPGGFPRVAGLNSPVGGGLSMGLGPTNANMYYNDKWTSVASATYVRGNHTIKAGGEFRIDSWTDRNSRGAQGILNFTGNETALPYLQTTNIGGGNIGFPYASFLLGQVNNASVNAIQDPQWRKKAWGIYLQDTWKVTRRLTFDYGLRWDLQSQGREIHDRNSMFGPTIPNSAAGGLPGGIVYEGSGPGRCNCRFTDTYPYAIGPRLGAAYQLNEKTVLRAGWGITYTNLPTYSYFTNSPILGVGFDQISWDNPGFGEAAVLLQDGLQYNVADLYRATLGPGLRPLPGQLNAPGALLDRNGARPGRVMQWNISLQREIARNLVLEAAYVGNRAAWLPAPAMVNLNAISDERFQSFGLDLNNAADRDLLLSPINSPLAQQRGFTAPYPGFPATATVAQSLRPFPQFNNALTPRWSPLGSSWYDSLQVKLTKRYSHGLDFTASFTWQKELATGNAAGSALSVTGAMVNDVFNRTNQKTLAANSQPFIFVTGFNYQTPRWSANKFARAIFSDWMIGGLLRYSSGMPIPTPASNNNLGALNFQNGIPRDSQTNLATVMNRVPGEPLFLKDLNCGCIDPNKEFVLNPKAWVDPGPGQWGTSALFYNDFRYARRPDEQLSIGRSFPIREKMIFQIRAEFFNVFNRTYLANPDAANPAQTQTVNAQGVPTSGFGRINPAQLANTPRNGQIVARFQW